MLLCHKHTPQGPDLHSEVVYYNLKIHIMKSKISCKVCNDVISMLTSVFDA